MTRAPGPVRPSANGAIVVVHVVTGSREAGWAGIEGDALRYRTLSDGADGPVNDEVIRALGEIAGVADGPVEVLAGSCARRKRLLVRGVGAAAIERLILHSHLLTGTVSGG